MKVNKLIIVLCLVFVGYTTITLAQSKKKKSNTEQNDDENTDDAPKKSSKKSKKSAEDDGSSEEDYHPQHKAGRVEIELNNTNDNYFALPVDEDGIIVFGENAKVVDGKKTWFFKKYSTNLTEESDKKLEVSKYSFFLKKYYDKSSHCLYLYTIYSDKSMAHAVVGEVNFTIQLIKYNVRTTKVSTYEFAPPLTCNIFNFVVKNNVAYFGGKTMLTQKEQRKLMYSMMCCCTMPFYLGKYFNQPFFPAFFTYNFKTKAVKVETTNYPGNGEVMELSAEGDDSLKTVGALIANRPDKKLPIEYRIKTYEKGTLVRSNKMKVKAGDDLSDASIYKIDDQNDIVIGTYALSSKHGSKGVMPVTGSKGFYIAKYDNGHQLYYKHYPFEKYFTMSVKNLLGQKKTKAVKSLNLLVHDLIKRGDNEYLVMGDAYYAHYHTETRMVGNHTETVQVFDGWVFTSSLITDFDSETGKINWTETFEINSWPPSMNMYPRVKVLKNEASDDLVFVYNNGTDIISKKLHGNSLSDNGQKALPMSLKGSDDKVKKVKDSDIAYWYDNYFIAYGFQKIKKKGKLFSGRTVFYMNKINYKSKSSE